MANVNPVLSVLEVNESSIPYKKQRLKEWIKYRYAICKRHTLDLNIQIN